MVAPLFVDRDGHRTWFKWHRARRRAGDPVFTRTRILEGLRLGASIEVDLVIHGGHGFAIVHGTKFVLVDGKRQIRGYYDPSDAASASQLRDDLAALADGRAR